MSVVAVYNMKGGVGKTTTAVNLSYLAAASGQRVLLWDLDPQGAASFSFRVRPRVADFGRKSLERVETLNAAIRETDYPNLDVLPADFAYRKFDRLLECLGRPARVVGTLLDSIARDYDIVLLDCPAGFSLLIEGVFGTVDAVLVPTIPTVLSLRTVARIVKWAYRSDSPATLTAFLSMVDRRKGLHRRACEWAARHPDVFLAEQIPYASVVEQMTVQRKPLAVFAARDAATIAFGRMWTEADQRLRHSEDAGEPARNRWGKLLKAIESLLAELEMTDGQHGPSPRFDVRTRSASAPSGGGPRPMHVVHTFDTEHRELQQRGHVLELREREGRSLVVIARCRGVGSGPTSQAEAQIDGSWARQILAGEMSPLAALDRRLGRPGPAPVEDIRKIIGENRLQRIASREMPHIVEPSTLSSLRA